MSTPDFNWFAITPTGPHTAPGANDRGWRLEVTMRRTPRVVSVHPMGSHLSLPTRGHKVAPGRSRQQLTEQSWTLGCAMVMGLGLEPDAIVATALLGCYRRGSPLA